MSRKQAPRRKAQPAKQPVSLPVAPRTAWRLIVGSIAVLGTAALATWAIAARVPEKTLMAAATTGSEAGFVVRQVEITGAISQAGSLRGLNLIRVANMDADSIATLLTRVTAPALTQKEINEMHTLDFIGLAELLVPFLNPPEPGASNVAETESE